MKDLFLLDDHEAIRMAAGAYKVAVPAHESEEYIKSVLELFDTKHPQTKADGNARQQSEMNLKEATFN